MSDVHTSDNSSPEAPHNDPSASETQMSREEELALLRKRVTELEAETTTLRTERDQVQATWNNAMHHIGQIVKGHRSRTELIAELQEQSLLDPKTGLFHYPAFEAIAREKVEPITRETHGRPNSLILADLDDFKIINSILGLEETDNQCLLPAAEIMKDAVAQRQDDIAGRFGGEEFVVLLPGTDLEGARLVAEKIRAAINKIHFERQLSGEDTVSERLGISMGITSFTQGASYETAFNDANALLKQAKETEGKNQIVTSEALLQSEN